MAGNMGLDDNFKKLSVENDEWINCDGFLEFDGSFAGNVSYRESQHFITMVCNYKETNNIPDQLAFYTFPNLLEGNAKCWWISTVETLRGWKHLIEEFRRSFVRPRSVRSVFQDVFAIMNSPYNVNSRSRYAKIVSITSIFDQISMDDIRAALFIMISPDELVEQLPDVDEIPFAKLGNEMWKIENKLKAGVNPGSSTGSLGSQEENVTIVTPSFTLLPDEVTREIGSNGFTRLMKRGKEFSGEESDLDTYAFINIVKNYKEAFHISDEDALSSFHVLLKGEAYGWWFRNFGMKDGVDDWAQKIFEFEVSFTSSKHLFMSPNRIFEIVAEMMAQKKKTNSLRRHCELKMLTTGLEKTTMDEIRAALYMLISPKELIEKLPFWAREESFVKLRDLMCRYENYL